ncbi:MAG: PDZ domain-containing protein, partial [Eubacterium sp.]|nr:PDZ domain-containing protein [Eubacterium sp.]
MRKFIRIADGVIASFLVVIFAFVIYGSTALPSELNISSDADKTIARLYSVSSVSEKSVDYQSADAVGENKSELNFLGIVPVKEESIKNVSEKKVYVSGQSFGIKLYTNGVIVVGTKDITVNGKTVNPAKQAGIEVGDVIVSINSQKVYSSDRVQQILNDNNGRSFEICINRAGDYKTLTLVPVYSEAEGCYKAGMWVRDSTAGIGTITFYNPSNSTVAALGHPITDVDTGKIMPILNGEAVETMVTSVAKSSPNETGSVCCEFLSQTIGTLKENTNQGVYGKYNEGVDLSQYHEYSVAKKQEVEKGFCQIITTVDESGPQVYSAEITKIYYNDEEKNMIIKIT